MFAQKVSLEHFENENMKIFTIWNIFFQIKNIWMASNFGNLIRIRRNIKLSNVVSVRTVKAQEERLANGEITPMQFLHYMAHRTVTPNLPQDDPDQEEADAELAAELAEEGIDEDDDEDDEDDGDDVFDDE